MTAPARSPLSGWRVLVVEDDDELREVLASSLALAGLDLFTARNASEALLEVQRVQPHLALIDVGLPGRNGFEFGRGLREAGHRVAIIYLTARGELRDKLTAFESGADDYLTKPFSLAELVARIRAVIGRTFGDHEQGVLRYADVEIDEARHLASRGGRALTLTPTEFRLLSYLLVNAGYVLSRQQLLTHVWGYDYEGNTSVVENYISFLRRKLDDREGHLIRTIRGIGYCLRSDEGAEECG
ncbi:MAG TPA: response regulator transcription factor [Acidimicrobiales bacterium]